MNIVQKMLNLSSDTVPVPDCVWFCEDLKPVDVKLYKVLLQYAKIALEHKYGKKDEANNPVVDVSQATLASKVGVTEKTIQACLQRLKNVQLVSVENNRGFKKNNLISMLTTFFDKLVEKTDNVVQFPQKNEAEPEKKEDKELTEMRKKPRKNRAGEILVVRKPFKIPDNMKYYMKLRAMGEHTKEEKEIIGISKHYSMLVMKHLGSTGHRSLSDNPTKHKNWVHFKRVYNLCKEKGWDPLLFVEAQFDRAKRFWTNTKISYPLPTMLYSEKACNYFYWFKRDREMKYAKEGQHRNTGAQKTMTHKQLLVKEILTSTKYLKLYIDEEAEERRQQEDKALRIYHAWETYSPAYLWTIPWFHNFVDELLENDPDNKRANEIKKTFDRIGNSKALREYVSSVVDVAERKYNIPDNIAL